MKILPFTIQGERLALDLDQVESVEIAVAITLVPFSPPPVAGILPHRGVLIPVWNTFVLAGLPTQSLGRCPQYIAVLVKGQSIALPVDGVDAPSPMDAPSEKWRLHNYHGLTVYRPAGRPLSYRAETPPSAFTAEDI